MRLALAALGVLACAACASPEPEPPERVLPETVPVEVLSQEKRALLEAYGAGGDVWREARERARRDPELTRFLVDNLTVEMVRAYIGLASPGTSGARAAFERAQGELVQFGEASCEVLVALLEVADDVIATVATQTLERIGRPAVAPANALLEADAPIARRRAAALLARLPHGAALEADVRDGLARLLAADSDWMVRAEAARALGLRGARDRETAPVRAALEPAITDADEYVARAASEGLAALGDPLAIPALIRALGRAVEAGEPRLVRSLEATLRALSGERRPLDLRGWRDWWYEHRDDLLRAAAGP